MNGFEDDLREAARAVVDGMLQGLADLSDDERIEAEAVLTSVLFDEAIGLCVRRGLAVPAILKHVEEHATEYVVAHPAPPRPGAN